MLQGLVTDVDSWLWLLGLAAATLLLAWCVNALRLYWHSKALRRQFRETYLS